MPFSGQPLVFVDLCPGNPLLSGTNPHLKLPFIPEYMPFPGRPRATSGRGGGPLPGAPRTRPPCSRRVPLCAAAVPQDRVKALTAVNYKQLRINTFQCLGYAKTTPEATILIDYQSIPECGNSVVLKGVYQTDKRNRNKTTRAKRVGTSTAIGSGGYCRA